MSPFANLHMEVVCIPPDRNASCKGFHSFRAVWPYSVARKRHRPNRSDSLIDASHCFGTIILKIIEVKG